MIDLFSEPEQEQKHLEINEHEITFPIYVKNRTSTRFTWYKNETQFEEITINAHNEPVIGNLMFGFNEQLILLCDKKTWLNSVLIAHEIIEQDEYDSQFAKLINKRTDFFDDAIENKYTMPKLTERQQNIKHKYPKI